MTVSIDGTLGVTAPQIILTNGTSTVTLLPPASGTLTGTPVFQSTSGALTLTNTSGGSLILQPAAGSTTAQTLAFPATAGTNGQVLTSNGAGGSTWGAGGGGGGTPGGASSQVQYNNAGAFGGVAGFTFDGTAGITLGVSSTTTGSLVLASSTSAFKTTLRSSTNTANWTFTLPTGPGNLDETLITDGAGNTSWGVAGSGAATGGNFDIGTPGGGTSPTTGTLNLYNAGSTDGVTISSGVNTSPWTFTLPPDPGVSGELLSTDGAGNTTWVTGGVTIGTTIINLGATALTLGGLTSVSVTQDPTSGLELATKQYVDANIDPLNRLAPVNAATLTNVASLTGPATIDGVALVAGNRVLLVGQSTPSQNGIWEIGTPWIRPDDANNWGEIVAADVYVLSGGTTLGSTSWVQITPAPGTMDVTAQQWDQQAGLNNYNSGLGINIALGNIIQNTGVVVLSGGTTGLTNTFTPATGQATLGGTLAVTHGGTGVTSSIGTGSVVLSNSPEIVSLREKKTNGTIAAGVLTIDCALGNVLAVTLNANITTVTFTNAPTSGTSYSIILSFTADGTPRTITWPASVRWPNGTAPTMTSTVSKVDTIVLYTYDGGASWFGFVSGQNA
jgi:hypothetical protein